MITYTSMPTNGDSISYTNARLNSIGNYTQAGTNYHWQYDTLQPTTAGNRIFTNNTPYIFFFGPTRIGEKIADTLLSQNIPTFGQVTLTDFYQFYKNTPAVYEVEGMGLKINGIPVPAFYTDKDELYIFPLQYGDKDSTSFRFSTPTSTAIPIVYRKNGYRITNIDGWGSITTPYGTYNNCIRLITTQYSKDTIIYNSSFGSIPITFKNYQRSYQWLSPDEKIPVLEVSGGINPNTGTFTPNNIRYRYDAAKVNVPEILKNQIINIFPNPSNGIFYLPNVFSTNHIQISLYNTIGQNVFNYTDEINFSDNVQIDASHLPNGQYFGFVKDQNTIYYFNFQISK